MSSVSPHIHISTCVRPVVAAVTELSIKCKDDAMEFAAEGEEETVRITPPIVTTKGGTMPHNVFADPDVAIELTDLATSSKDFKYTVTDAEGCVATCTVTLSILPGKIVDSNKGITGDAVCVRFW